MSITQLPSGSWRTQLRQKHFPRFDEVHATRAEAQASEDAEVARRRGTVSAGPRMLLKDAITQYQSSSDYTDHKPATIRGYNRALTEVSLGLGEYTLEYLGQMVSVINKYVDKRRKTISVRTGRVIGRDAVRIELSALSQVFVWCVENKIFTHNPLAVIRRKRGPRRKRRLHPDESVNLKLLAERGKPDSHRIFARFLLLELELYCRPGELAQLLVSDIDLAERECVLLNTKNGSDRTVHLTDAASELISAQLVEAALTGSPFLFHSITRAGKHRLYNYAWPAKQFKKLGYVRPGFVPHVMRKESISSALESNVAVGTVSIMSGHGSLQAVEDYKIDLRATDAAREALDAHSRRQKIESDADVNNQLPPALVLARAQQMFAALSPEVQKKLLSSLAVPVGETSK